MIMIIPICGKNGVYLDFFPSGGSFLLHDSCSSDEDRSYVSLPDTWYEEKNAYCIHGDDIS